jgi:hypothetical protein
MWGCFCWRSGEAEPSHPFSRRAVSANPHDHDIGHIMVIVCDRDGPWPRATKAAGASMRTVMALRSRPCMHAGKQIMLMSSPNCGTDHAFASTPARGLFHVHPACQVDASGLHARMHGRYST